MKTKTQKNIMRIALKTSSCDVLNDYNKSIIDFKNLISAQYKILHSVADFCEIDTDFVSLAEQFLKQF